MALLALGLLVAGVSGELICTLKIVCDDCIGRRQRRLRMSPWRWLMPDQVSRRTAAYTQPTFSLSLTGRSACFAIRERFVETLHCCFAMVQASSLPSPKSRCRSLSTMSATRQEPRVARALHCATVPMLAVAA